jgi:hypothetical protein
MGVDQHEGGMRKVEADQTDRQHAEKMAEAVD